ncbi:MAG: hypothetical protein KIS81_05445 [Maricaulaceae bacterium]|nr:hypothetical protein [Maricaulaceae bacterium]
MKHAMLCCAATGALLFSAAGHAADSGGAACAYIVERGSETIHQTGFSVVQLGAAPGRIALPAAPRGSTAVGCIRDTAVPFPNDYKVLAEGWPLVIQAPATRRRAGVVAVLSIRDNQFHYSVTEGEVTVVEREQIAARIEGFYEAWDTLIAMN